MKLREELGKLALDMFKIIVGTVLIGSVFTDAINKIQTAVIGAVLAIIFLTLGIILIKRS